MTHEIDDTPFGRAITLRDGLAGRLLAAWADIAGRHGIVRFEAEVLAHNGAMLAVFRRSGLPMRVRHAGDVARVSLDLKPEPADRSRGALSEGPGPH